jgi:hypothetical protein
MAAFWTASGGGYCRKLAALLLAGCNANQGPISRPIAPRAVADCNPYDPTSYAQNNTGIGGGGH